MTGSPLIRRAVTVTDVDTRSHELTALIVPYDVPSRVVDPPERSQSGDWDEYLEAFAPHAFHRQIAYRAGWANVTLSDRHDGEPVGYALELADSTDTPGLVGTFRIRPRAFDDVAQMIADGIDAVSAGFVPVKSRTERRDGRDVRVRTVAALDHVALEPVGAYPGAGVLAFRSAPPAATPNRDELAAFLAQLKTRKEHP